MCLKNVLIMPKYKNILDLSARSKKNRENQSTINSSFPIKNTSPPSLNNPPQNSNPQTAVLHDVDLHIHLDDNYPQSDSDEETLSDFEEQEEESREEKFTIFLRKWTLENNVTRTAVTILLKFLKQNGESYLPMDSRTLMKTPTSREVIDVSPGKYCHIGVKTALDYFLSSLKKCPSSITININIDGVPISRSSQSGFWTILIKVIEPNSSVLTVGVYHGYKKPKNFSNFLQPFADEMKVLMENYEYSNQRVEIKIGAFICDAPARAGCTGTKGHGAYFGCGRCSQEGEFLKNRMTFPEFDARLRTDVNFRDRENDSYHLYRSPFENLNLDMVTQFPIEYLHGVCLGPFKKLLRMWIAGDNVSRLSNYDIQRISDNFVSISRTQPSEFQRRLRPLSDSSYFKGSEFRTIGLYAGPFAFKNILSSDRYDNFMLLNVAITIFINEKLCQTLGHVAKALIKTFIESFMEIYGPHHIVFNMHNLFHMNDDVQKYGALDKYSAFAFESYMCKVKQILRKNNQSLAQICNRISELYQSPIVENRSSQFPELKKREKRKVNDTSEFIYKQIVFENFKIDFSKRNCWFLTKNKEIICFEFCQILNGKILMFGAEILNKTNFYETPIESKYFDIYEAPNKKGISKLWGLDCISKKLWGMENIKDNTIVFFPLQHCST